MKKYDIFISYRRSAFESAQTIASSLKAAGYRVFIDIESLRSGKFNEQLYHVIDNCNDFILVLPKGALDRCVDENDWVRLEVERAMSKNKNLIPVMLAEFSWPEPMPHGLEELKNYQAITSSSSEYFDLSMKRLASYLKSRSHARPKRIATWAISILAVLCLLGAFSARLIKHFSLPLYTQVADNMTSQVSVLNILGDINESIQETWREFLDDYQQPAKAMLLPELFDNLETTLNHELETLPTLQNQLRATKITLTPLQAFQIALRGVNTEEVLLAQPFCETFFDDIKHEVELIRQSIEDKEVSLTEKKLVNDRFDIFRICSNAYYYGYLSVLAKLPKGALNNYRTLVVNWHHFPNGVGLNHSEEEFEDFIKREHDLLRDYNYDLSSRNLSMQQELDDALGEYQAIDSKFTSLYEGILKDAPASPDAHPFDDWIKIVSVASFLPDIIETENDPDLQPLSLETGRVKKDIGHLVDVFSSAHPEYAAAAAKAKSYYNNIADGKQPYRGLVVAEISDSTPGGIQVGDIVTAINDIPSTTGNMQKLTEMISGRTIEHLSLLSLDESGTWHSRRVDFNNATKQIGFFPLVMIEE